NALTRSFKDWPHLMMHVFPWKANGLIWLGQAFVPFAYLTSSVDKALLLTIFVTQLTTLIVMYRSLDGLANHSAKGPILACLVIASAPLTVSLGQQYMVESTQMLSVAWFVYLMCLAPRMSRPHIFAHLLAASSFALLTKVSQPLFCVVPGIFVSSYLLRR